MYSGEDMLLNLRINELNRFVDKFVISEAAYHHDGSKKKLTFKIKDYPLIIKLLQIKKKY